MTNVRVDGLRLYLTECMQDAVDEAAKKALDYLTDYIEKNWYDKYDPIRYQRTRDFLKSASKTETTITRKSGKNDEIICMLYFDTSKIYPRYFGEGHLNQHVSFSGESVVEMIPRWIERGNRGLIGRDGRALGSMEATIKMLEKNFHKMVAKELKNQGLNIKVSAK